MQRLSCHLHLHMSDLRSRGRTGKTSTCRDQLECLTSPCSDGRASLQMRRTNVPRSLYGRESRDLKLKIVINLSLYCSVYQTNLPCQFLPSSQEVWSHQHAEGQRHQMPLETRTCKVRDIRTYMRPEHLAFATATHMRLKSKSNCKS